MLSTIPEIWALDDDNDDDNDDNDDDDFPAILSLCT